MIFLHSSSIRRLVQAVPLCAGAVFLASGLAQAANLYDDLPPGLTTQIKISQTGSWDSNPLMLAHGAKSLWGSKTSPELILRDDEPTYQFNADTRVDENLYDQSDYNSTDFHENAGFTKILQRWTAGLLGKADIDTARSSEVTTFGLNLPNVRHHGFSLTPQVTFNPTSIDKIAVAGTAAKSTYDNNAFTDYDYYSLNPTYTHNLTPTSAGTFTLNAQRYETANTPSLTADTIGPSVGWQYTPNQTVSSKITAGVEKSWQSGAAGRTRGDQWNYVFTGDLTYKGQRDTVDFIASRAQQPFGNGTETLLTTFTAKDSHALNELFSLNGAATYQFAKYSSLPGVNLKDQIIANGGLAYHVIETMDITANYKYRSENLTNVNTTIRDNAVLIGLAYHPPAGAL